MTDNTSNTPAELDQAVAPDAFHLTAAGIDKIAAHTGESPDAVVAAANAQGWTADAPTADIHATLAAAGVTAVVDPDGEVLAVDHARFAPGYEVADARIFRARLYPSATDGTATVTFRGTVEDATRCWVTRGRSGRISLYAEVTPTTDTATEIKVAVVPTGKRIPTVDGHAGPEPTLRLGSVGTEHVYLLSVDSSVDREAYDAERAARKAQRDADRRFGAGVFFQGRPVYAADDNGNLL